MNFMSSGGGSPMKGGQSGLKASVGLFGKLVQAWAFDATEVEKLLERISTILRANSLMHNYADGAGGLQPARDTMLMLFPDVVTRLQLLQVTELDGLILQLKSFCTTMGDTLAAMQMETLKATGAARMMDAGALTTGIFTADHVLHMEDLLATFSLQYSQWTAALSPLLSGWRTGTPSSPMATHASGTGSGTGLAEICMDPTALSTLQTHMKAGKAAHMDIVTDFLRINGFPNLP
jgi:hypothetical protein